MFIRYESHAGENVDIWPQQFQPLSYSDLVTDYKDPDKRYPISMEASSNLSTQTDGKRKGPANVSIPLVFREPVSIFALVDGGWLPPPFVIPAIFLVDRNLVATFVRIKEQIEASNLTEGDFWIQFFREFAVVINPAPYALEGNKRRLPSFDGSVEHLKKHRLRFQNDFREHNWLSMKRSILRLRMPSFPILLTGWNVRPSS